MEPTLNGRALPPRPTLLVGKAGDIDACRSAWISLQPLAANVLGRSRAGCASAEELDGVVRRFRSLRESLVAAYCRDQLAIEVYEASADVCLAARCWPEYLKSVSGLTSDLYPAAQQQLRNPPQQQQQPAGGNAKGEDAPRSEAEETGGSTRSACGGSDRTTPEAAHGGGVSGGGVSGGGVSGGGGGSGGNESDSPAPGGPPEVSCSGRCSEMYAAHCLFVACVPSGRVTDAVAVLRRPQVLAASASEHVRFAAKVLAAMALGDWHGFLCLRQGAPSASLRSILDLRAGQVRSAALSCLAAAHRSLPTSVAVTMLRLPDADHDTNGGDGAAAAAAAGKGLVAGGSAVQPVVVVAALREVLAAAAAEGVKGAQIALDKWSGWEVEGAEGPVELAFRA